MTNHIFSESQKVKKMPPPGIAPGLPAPQAGVLLLYYSGRWRIRVSIPVLNLAKVVCYHVQQSPGCASIGTRTRILSLEGTNTTLVLWTQDSGSQLTHRLSTCAKRPPNQRVRGGRFELPTNGSLRRRTLQSTALPTELPPGPPPLGIEPRT